MIAVRRGRTDITNILLEGKHINLDIQEKVRDHRTIAEASGINLWLSPELQNTKVQTLSELCMCHSAN